MQIQGFQTIILNKFLTLKQEQELWQNLKTM